ncbi:MAG TPA: hypothetical protein VMV94_07035 [Phycisphaerae bacterium]|nr:hypothetical protein [Phycisphaerae bacterium]
MDEPRIKVTFHARCDICKHYVFKQDSAVFLAINRNTATKNLEAAHTVLEREASFPPSNVRTVCLKCADAIAGARLTMAARGIG